ncbi:S24 family peptidase [Neisseria montereyensis]|uniref:S24 family peptidase n=1 Tax=Neisseria montereyensis TaxID=2973938 RepID=A0ABT2FDJ9_9NEIS|nr:S24 family peptidase [Neisseria montereyensis]MCS4534282.1 S24 family peptidase [Neisseria montereyensis]
MKKMFSVSEIESLVSKFGLLSLPNTGRAIQYRAQNENWKYSEAPSQGGKRGVKKIYLLPEYVVNELKQKGIFDLLANEFDEAETPTDQNLKESENWLADYDDWANKQDRDRIVPVRYYKQVFASAGSGSIPWDTNPEAMWFRDAFFTYLGLRPDSCFCTRIDGDSMAPTLIDQGTALWQAVSQYTREGIYLFRQGDELRVKRLQRLNTHTYRIISDNANKSIYPTTDLDLTQMQSHEFEIYGRYLWSCGIAK